MEFNTFDALQFDAQLIYIKLKGSLIEELVLEDELIRLYAIHDYLVALVINKGNYKVKSIYPIDTTEEKIWADICIDALFV